jgi:diaminopimelate decarboxylase
MLQTSTMTMFHVVFALKANTDYSVVECFHDLSQKIGVAIKYEER